MNAQFDGSADLMMNMVGAMVIMLALFVPLAQLEQMTHLDTQSKESSTRSFSQEGVELALIEIGLGEDPESLMIRWKPHDKDESIALNDYRTLVETLQQHRPDAIRLRMDRRVPSGVMQDLMVAASEQGIAIMQSNRVSQDRDP